MTEQKNYKDTVNLPQTSFNMRANAVKREPELQQFWQDEQIYQKSADNNPKDLFILHDIFCGFYFFLRFRDRRYEGKACCQNFIGSGLV